MMATVPLLLLPGCATTGGATNPAATAQSAGPGADEGGLPAVDLTGDLLNDLLLADIAARRGHLDLSVDLYLQQAQVTGDPRLAERATRVAVFSRADEQALKAAELWVRQEPENMEARQLAAALLIRADRPDDALPHIEKLLSASNDGGENGFMVVAGFLSREKDKRAAMDVMRRFTETRQNNADAMYAYAHLAARLGEWTVAEQAIDRTLALRPDWDQAVVQKAQILRSQHKNAQSLDVMQKAVQRAPDTPVYRLVYARFLADSERLPEAYEQFKALRELQPDNDDALFALALLSLDLGKLDEADADLNELRRRGTRGEEVFYYLGRLEETRGNNAEAKRWYGQVGDGEHYLNAQIRVVVMKSQENDLAGARALLDSLRAQRPGQGLRLYLVEGELLSDASKYAEAYDLYTKALQEYADNAELLYARAMAAEKLDRLDALEQDLRKVLARDPNNAEALNALGYTLADRTTRYEEALDLVKRAIELRPNDFFVLDSMGWVYYRLGDYEQALRYLRRALEVKMDPEVAAHLGEVLWVSGDKDGARAVWQRVLDEYKGKRTVVTDVMERLDAK
jgi:tetratricopeptide (TPR) repeat protein